MPLKFRKQPSGGRGDYEVNGEDGGVSAADLDGCRFTILTPAGPRESQLFLSHQGGKRRVRLVKTGTGIQIQRQVAAVALLPASTRDERRVSEGLPVLIEKAYILDVGFRLVGRAGDVATIEPTTLIGRSGDESDTHHRVELSFNDRMRLLGRVNQERGRLPSPIREALQQHELELLSPTIGSGAEQAVKRVMQSLEDSSEEYLPGTDPLPTLAAWLGLATSVDLPTPPETPVSRPDIRLRVEIEHRMRRIRGPGAANFRRGVRRAYDSRCAFCGFRAPTRQDPAKHYRANAGVDAAHILPWGEYDLDVVPNGLVLCKQHHWAFDNHVLRLGHASGNYYVELDTDYEAFVKPDVLTHSALLNATGRIPTERLPAKASDRPAPKYIDELYSAGA